MDLRGGVRSPGKIERLARRRAWRVQHVRFSRKMVFCCERRPRRSSACPVSRSIRPAWKNALMRSARSRGKRRCAAPPEKTQHTQFQNGNHDFIRNMPIRNTPKCWAQSSVRPGSPGRQCAALVKLTNTNAPALKARHLLQRACWRMVRCEYGYPAPTRTVLSSRSLAPLADVRTHGPSRALARAKCSLRRDAALLVAAVAWLCRGRVGGGRRLVVESAVERVPVLGEGHSPRWLPLVAVEPRVTVPPRALQPRDASRLACVHAGGRQKEEAGGRDGRGA